MSIEKNELPPEFDRDNFYTYLYVLDDYKGNYPEGFKKAWSLIDELKFNDALIIFEDLAGKGDVYSQTNAGGIMESYPPLKDIEKARAWYKKAVEQGSDKARAFLGEQYHNDGNFEEAYKLLSTAATNGNPDACANLSGMYAHGELVDKDLDKAIELRLFSVNNSSKDRVEPGIGHFFLGNLYGENGEEDKAIIAFKEAAKRQPELALVQYKHFATEKTEAQLEDFVHGGYSAPPSEETKFLIKWHSFWENIARQYFPKEAEEISYQITSYHMMREGELEDLMRRNRQAKATGCFIATSVYGDYDAPEVRKLRIFRDEVLLKSNFGKFFVKIYYKYSPGIADVIDKNPKIRPIIKSIFLVPFLFLLKNKIHTKLINTKN